MHVLGRRHAPDSRDHAHLMSALLPSAVVRPKSKSWRIWWKGNQQDTPRCVGFAFHGMLRALPLLQREPSPETIYHEAQKVDEWPGEDEASGTSVRAGAKYLKSIGKITAYSWAFDLQTALTWIGLHGAVVFGTDWHGSMFQTDSTGLVVPDGNVVGGHAYLGLGYDDKKKILICQNSWGNDFGIKGRFHLNYSDADSLIKAQGEACVASE